MNDQEIIFPPDLIIDRDYQKYLIDLYRNKKISAKTFTFDYKEIVEKEDKRYIYLELKLSQNIQKTICQMIIQAKYSFVKYIITNHFPDQLAFLEKLEILK